METLKGYILITRPVNCLIGFIAIFIGGLVSGILLPFLPLLLACLSGTLIAAGANTINDYFDVAIDRINKPKRPLPSGSIGLRQAYVFSLVLFGSGIMLSVFIHLPGFLIAFFSSLLLYFYSYRLKRTVIWGNLTVALVSGMAFVYGGLAVRRTGQAAVAGVFAFLYHLAREMIKDAEDIEGDRAEGIKTLPIQYGIKTTLVWAMAVILFLIALTLVPFCIGMYGLAYLIMVVLGVDLFLICVIVSMFRKPEPKHLGRLAVFMKADMPIGLLAVYLGSLS